MHNYKFRAEHKYNLQKAPLCPNSHQLAHYIIKPGFYLQASFLHTQSPHTSLLLYSNFYFAYKGVLK